MKITAINAQKRDNNRVNVMVDGSYRFSLDIFQIADLGIKVGQEFDEAELVKLENESVFGKVYGRSLEYCLIRPRSEREIQEYLYKKTIARRTKTGSLKTGIDKTMIPRVIERLIEKGYIDDRKFAQFWIQNRFIKKGISQRRLIAELRNKGIENSTISELLEGSDRNDEVEIQKVINKKRKLYSDDSKLMAYLLRSGFNYDQIKNALNSD